ncbi:MAG: endonuclease/exonuclease/phosphatase family protein [Chloroflexi bacterium]|nr:endonuclease/exonuclease/phosphatase family protein [Chloroflexota bacterium]
MLTLTAMTYNIRAGTYSPEGLEAVARVIAGQGPDLVGLQEVDVGRQRSGFVHQARWLGQRLGMSWTFGAATESQEGEGPRGQFGNALLSRYPIVANRCRSLFRPDYSNQPGLPEWYSEQRSVIGAAVAAGSAPLWACVTHLGLTPDQRWQQVQEVSTFGQEGPAGALTLILGDLNALPDSLEMGYLQRYWRDACEVAGLAASTRQTFPSGPMGSATGDGWSGAIDYILVGPGLQVQNAWVVHDETRASDHNPLVARLRMVPL